MTGKKEDGLAKDLREGGGESSGETPGGPGGWGTQQELTACLEPSQERTRWRTRCRLLEGAGHKVSSSLDREQSH